VYIYLFTYLFSPFGFLLAGPFPVAAHSTAKVCGRLAEEIMGSNPTKGMDACLLWVLYIVW
jgi:hypothetical protein